MPVEREERAEVLVERLVVIVVIVHGVREEREGLNRRAATSPSQTPPGRTRYGIRFFMWGVACTPRASPARNPVIRDKVPERRALQHVRV